MHQAPGHCPSCESVLGLRELGCSNCGTTVRGVWAPSPFQQLSSDQQAFLILFVRSRGNLSEVERALGVSYPTVRGKLEEVIQALSGDEADEIAEDENSESGRREVLERVSRGEISAAEAIAELRRQQKSEA